MTGVAPLLLAVLSAAGPCTTEPWPLGSGQVLARFAATSASASEVFDTRGERAPFPGRRYKESADTLDVEVGLSRALTAAVAVPYRKVRAEGFDSGGVASGFGDLDARLRASFAVGRAAWLGGEAGVLTPLGSSRADAPRLRSGHTDAIASVVFGASLPALPEGFVSAALGYRWRGGPIADEVPYALTAGAFPHARVGVFAFARGWKSRADFSRVPDTAGFLVSDSERLAVGLELFGRVARHTDVSISYGRVVSGRNVPVAHPLVIGVAWHSQTLLPRRRS